MILNLSFIEKININTCKSIKISANIPSNLYSNLFPIFGSTFVMKGASGNDTALSSIP